MATHAGPGLRGPALFRPGPSDPRCREEQWSHVQLLRGLGSPAGLRGLRGKTGGSGGGCRLLPGFGKRSIAPCNDGDGVRPKRVMEAPCTDSCIKTS